MITNITLENFKCFRHISVDPKLVTVFIGPNGTGKSGIIQALLLLKQSRNNVASLNLAGELLRFAPEAFVLHAREVDSHEVRIWLTVHSSIESEEIQIPLTFEIDLMYSPEGQLIVDGGLTMWETSGQQNTIHFDRSLERPQAQTPKGGILYDVLPQVNSFNVVYGMHGENPNAPLWQQLSQAPSKMLSNLKMVPAARGLVREVYTLGSTSFDDISGATGLGTQEDNTATTLAYSRLAVERVSNLIKRITEVGFRVDTVPPQSAKPVSETVVGDVNLLAEGFGTNALIHLLFEMVRAVPGSTVLIEEPEIHLHPKAQAELASVLVKEAKTSDKQIIMTTHSEHVIGRLMTLVAEGKLLAEEVAIYSFEKDKTGVCSASEIKVTDSGQVSGGLKGFFETDMDEMQRYVEALRARA